MNHDARSILLLVNPMSGGGRAVPRATQLAGHLSNLGYRVTRFDSRRAQEITRHVATVGRDHHVLVAVGGDGTVREVVAGLPTPAPALAVLPSGSANVLAAAVPLPHAPQDVARIIDDGTSRPIDTGLLVSDHASPTGAPDGPRRAVFLLMVGAGIDSRIVQRVHEARRGGTLGKLRYVRPAIAALTRFQPVAHWIELDDGSREGPFAQVIVTNIASYGGFWTLPGPIDSQDGRLDVFGFRSRGRIDLLRHAIDGAVGRLTIGPRLLHAQVRHVRLEADPPSPVQVDGDPFGWCPCEIRAGTSPVRLLVPRSNG